jgi:hypothetical protein
VSSADGGKRSLGNLSTDLPRRTAGVQSGPTPQPDASEQTNYGKLYVVHSFSGRSRPWAPDRTTQKIPLRTRRFAAWLVREHHIDDAIPALHTACRTASSRAMLTEHIFAAPPGRRSRDRRALPEGRGHGASDRVFERRGLVELPVISLR